MAQVVRTARRMALVLGAGILPAGAQSLALPAADPVGISRAGAQVAYGYSLEAAALNPALLASLREKGGAYLAAGLELASTQQSLEASQKTWYSTDRNRTLGAFGMALRLSPALTLGLKLDQPFLRHGALLPDAPSRYLGDAIDLSAHRLEGQAAWALTPQISVGLGLGVVRLSFESRSVMNLGVPADPTQPVSPTNLVDGLVEQRVRQQGDKVVPSYSLGARWALSPRWTLGFAHQSGLKGDLGLAAGFESAPLRYWAYDGLSTAPVGIAPRAATLLGVSQALPGSPTLELPSQTTVGVRHRLSPMVTWEADLRWTAAGLRVPSFAAVQTPSGLASAPQSLPEGRGHLAVSASLEVELGRSWTIRGGLSLDGRSVDEARTEPLLGGTRSAGFAIGAGYRVWGGELSLGYQYRQSEDQDTRSLVGVWSASGYRSVGTRVRMEGMGHLAAIGFKKSF